MEWWGYLTSGAGLVGGVVGAWKSFRTDRRLKLLEERWVLERNGRDFMDLVSKLGHTARNVRVEGESGVFVEVVDGAMDEIPPGDFRRLVVDRFYSTQGTAIVVTWRHRTVFGSRARSMRVPTLSS